LRIISKHFETFLKQQKLYDIFRKNIIKNVYYLLTLKKQQEAYEMHTVL
jgi:hypothetical protein